MLQNKKNMKKNQGFSLVELLVAIAILAVVVVPLLQLFVSGARTNAKARQISRATVSARNLMEEIKSTNVGDMLRAVNSYTVDENGNIVINPFQGLTVYEALLSGGAGSEVYTKTVAGNSAITANVNASTGAVLETYFTPNNTGTYNVVAQNIVNGGSSFDVVMSFVKDGAKSLSKANISSMNQHDCGYYAMTAEEASTVAGKFADSNATYRSANPAAGSPVMTGANFFASMTKTITVDVTQDSGNNSVSATVTTTYDAGDNMTAEAERYISTTETIFDNYGTDTTLNSLFIYYYPLYNTGLSARDSVVINNPAGIKCNVYLICMPENTTYSAYNEQNYKCSLNLADATSLVAQNFNTKVLSNLETARFAIEDNNVVLALTIDDLGNTSMEDIFYNVSITLYKHDDAAFSVDGSGNTTFTPEASKFVTTFTSSIIDNSVSKH